MNRAKKNGRLLTSQNSLVELGGIEPPTSSMPRKRAPSAPQPRYLARIIICRISTPVNKKPVATIVAALRVVHNSLQDIVEPDMPGDIRYNRSAP